MRPTDKLLLIEDPSVRRITLVQRSLEGLALGDAFGETFFGPREQVEIRLARRETRSGVWGWTDDTAQARALVGCLRLRGEVEPEVFCRLLSEEYQRDPSRGYGAGTHAFMGEVRRGVPWRRASPAAFEGRGSFGNGAAMRVAPLGAYFYDLPTSQLCEQARLSAQVTHWHEEAVAGAEAVALAAAWATREGVGGVSMLESVRDAITPGRVRDGLSKALEVPLETTKPEEAARVLGSGQEIAAYDTVPFTLWCAARHASSYQEALWSTVAGFGDRDTTCAIVGGIVALSSLSDFPPAWLEAREPL